MGPIEMLHRSTPCRDTPFSGSIQTIAAAALIWLAAGTAASGQTGPSAAYDRAAVIEAICRQYAAAQTGMPADLMFRQCMSEQHCRVSPDAPGYRCEAPAPMSWHGGGY
jgi:hypothetical protein